MFGRRISRALFVGVTLLVSVPVTSVAQSDRPPVTPPPPSDFMLGRPKGFIAVDGGVLVANAGSDVYDFIREQLTIEKKAFNAPVFGGRMGFAVSPRVEVAVMYEQSEASSKSEYRDFVDNQRLPITQTTGLKESHIAASIRWSLLPSGRRISRFAWIPRTITPFVGAGAGAIKYKFEQYGIFVDYQTLLVFNSTVRSVGLAPSAHAFAGADLRVYRKIYLSGEARYTWSSAALSEDFEDFDPITLAGVRVGGSLKLVF